MPEIISRKEEGYRAPYRRVKVTLADCKVCSRNYRKLGSDLTCSLVCRDILKNINWKKREEIKKARHFPNVYRHSCAQCAKVFISTSPTHRFCQKGCQSQYYVNRLGNIAKAKRHKEFGPKVCPLCGLQFEPENYHTKYCSPACKDSAIRFRERMFKSKTCRACGTVFEGSRRVVCSEVCAAKNMHWLQRRCRQRPEVRLKNKTAKRELKARQSVARIALAELGIEANGRVAFKALKELGIQI